MQSCMKLKMKFIFLAVVFIMRAHSYQISIRMTKLLPKIFRTTSNMFMLSKDVQTEIEKQLSIATGSKFVLAAGGVRSTSGGGGGASVGTIHDTAVPFREFFYKSAYGASGFDMLNAEYRGVSEMYETHTIRVPKPICKGTAGDNSFIIFEKLTMGGYGDSERMGRELAAMHKHTSKNGMFGWDINNTIGATLQPNTWNADWADFWDECRLGYMLKRCRSMDEYPREKELRAKVKTLLRAHSCVPSLVHGDLWSGNQAYTKEGDPVIFDPATYYGDREVDIAMTHLFGSNSAKFYAAYNKEWPLPEGYQQRQTIYNLYHILNHYVLFGGGYWSQACGMMDRILSF